MGKNIQYIQVTVRLPPKIYDFINEFAQENGLTLQDAIIIILFNCIEGEGEERC